MENLQLATEFQDACFQPKILESRKTTAEKGTMYPNAKELATLRSENSRWEEFLGPYAGRVLLVTANGQLTQGDIAVAGGICTLRTADVIELYERGIITSPTTGQPENVTSIEKFVRWIPKMVTFDQVVESIGFVNAQKAVVISEIDLWSRRIIDQLQEGLGIRISFQNKQRIQAAVELAESRIFIMAQRYRQYLQRECSIKSPELVQVKDTDIWEELIKVRDEILQASDLSIGEIAQSYDIEEEIVDSRSIVWAMYTQPYFELLKREGYLSDFDAAFVVEPIIHTTQVSKALKYGYTMIFRRNPYSGEGINNLTGFIAFLECLTKDGKTVRSALTTGFVPNVSNWERLFQNQNDESPLSGKLTFEQNQTLTLEENYLFIWGLNLCPFGKIQKALLELVDIRRRFTEQREKAKDQYRGINLGKNPESRIQLQNDIQNVKNTFLIEVAVQNKVIQEELYSLLNFLTN